jgi:hypothetical protein
VRLRGLVAEGVKWGGRGGGLSVELPLLEVGKLGGVQMRIWRANRGIALHARLRQNLPS